MLPVAVLYILQLMSYIARKFIAMKQFSKINRVLNVPALESVKGTVDLNLEQLQEIDNALANSPIVKLKMETAAANKESTRLSNQAAELRNEIATIEQQNSAMSEALNELHPLVAAQPTLARKVKAVRALLAAGPGAVITSLDDDEQHTADNNTVDWAIIDALPHNREADKHLPSKN